MTFQLKLGADPEQFLRKDGSFVSAHGLIPGTKENPHVVEGGAVQVDGMAVEFNISPSTTLAEFKANIALVTEQLGRMLEGYEVVSTPVAHFSAEYMASQPEEALELGCDPDFDAYTGEANERPNGKVLFRTAGGHVHVGWTTDAPKDHPEHLEACQMLARELDFFLGIPSLFWDREDSRRSMYGKAGAFRSKSYGMEYRSLSNAWLTDSRLIDFVFTQTKKAFEKLADGESFYNEYSRLACACLENNDRDLASVFLGEHPELAEGIEYLLEE